jgi:hypothetical protein
MKIKREILEKGYRHPLTSNGKGKVNTILK